MCVSSPLAPTNTRSQAAWHNSTQRERKREKKNYEQTKLWTKVRVKIRTRENDNERMTMKTGLVCYWEMLRLNDKDQHYIRKIWIERKENYIIETLRLRGHHFGVYAFKSILENTAGMILRLYSTRDNNIIIINDISKRNAHGSWWYSQL